MGWHIRKYSLLEDVLAEAGGKKYWFSVGWHTKKDSLLDVLDEAG